jgi:cytochrome c-type biogenesis protein CcmH/NrfF
MFEKLNNLINKNPILKYINNLLYPLPLLLFMLAVFVVYVMKLILELI